MENRCRAGFRLPTSEHRGREGRAYPKVGPWHAGRGFRVPRPHFWEHSAPQPHFWERVPPFSPGVHEIEAVARDEGFSRATAPLLGTFCATASLLGTSARKAGEKGPRQREGPPSISSTAPGGRSVRERSPFGLLLGGGHAVTQPSDSSVSFSFSSGV